MADSRKVLRAGNWRLGFGEMGLRIVCNEFHYNYVFLVLCFDTVVQCTLSMS